MGIFDNNYKQTCLLQLKEISTEIYKLKSSTALNIL